MKWAYYNELDQRKAAWLRELITRNLIAPGEVDERSIKEVQPADLAGFTQCHFFAGIGIWSYALRLAGWDDARPVWTGSCPCQPFSNAGSRKGTADARHLWPEWARLIKECRPATVFGEQVSSPAGLGWFDAVHADLEAAEYAVAAVDICAASVGAPHIRQRLYFVADTERCRHGRVGNGPRGGRELVGGGESGELGHAESRGLRVDGSAPRDAGYADESGATRAVGMADASFTGPQRGLRGWAHAERGGQHRHTGRDGAVGVALGDTNEGGRERRAQRDERPTAGKPASFGPDVERSGFWDACDWLPCRDGKARPVESGTFPLAHGAPARVVRLRGYGDGIVAPLAQAFIEAYREACAGTSSTQEAA